MAVIQNIRPKNPVVQMHRHIRILKYLWMDHIHIGVFFFFGLRNTINILAVGNVDREGQDL